jgi:uncharacterized membrane protein
VTGTRLRLETERVRDRIERGDPYWPAQLAIALAIALALTLSDRVTIGPTWLVPAVEGLLLAGLVVMAPSRATSHSRATRTLALTVIALVTVVNAVSLGLLVHFLINGGTAGGHRLLVSGAVLWLTNVLVFAVWYWELDRGGPVQRFAHPDGPVDLLFPQMASPGFAHPGWRPGFADYLYMSLTNATAFSPTDTMPLTHTAKAVMAVQSVTALLTVALVVARAVNILA